MTQIQVPSERRILPAEMIRVPAAAAKNINAVADGSLIRLPVHEDPRLSCVAGMKHKERYISSLDEMKCTGAPVYAVREPKPKE